MRERTRTSGGGAQSTSGPLPAGSSREWLLVTEPRYPKSR